MLNTKNTMIELSVLIPVHNAEDFIQHAVESVLAESIAGMEVVVVDDGSTDRSIARIQDLPIRIIRQPARGEAAARNSAVRAARGKYISFLDADDVITAGGLEARMDFLNNHPAEGAVGGFPTSLIDEKGALLAKVFEKMSRLYTFPFRLTDAFYRSGQFFPVSCALYMYRRDVFDRVGEYDETLRVAPDCEFHFRILRTLEIPMMRVPTFERRLHAQNLSLTGGKASPLVFKDSILNTVRQINAQYGFSPKEIVPWERDYL